MGALRKKTVILVTHQVEFLSAVDKILVRSTASNSISTSSTYLHMHVIYFEKKNSLVYTLLGHGRGASCSIRKL